MHLNEIENPINRVIFFNQDIGVIRYVGPIHGIGNDSGLSSFIKLFSFFSIILIFHIRNMVWY